MENIEETKIGTRMNLVQREVIYLIEKAIQEARERGEFIPDIVDEIIINVEKNYGI